MDVLQGAKLLMLERQTFLRVIKRAQKVHWLVFITTSNTRTSRHDNRITMIQEATSATDAA